MTAPLSTALPGRPEDAQAVAGWLRSGLGAGLGAAAGDLRVAGSLAATGWRGGAGEAFGKRAEQGRGGTESLAGDIDASARAVDGYATALGRAQAAMRDIRANAAAAGLTVASEDILPPGDAPPAPAPVGPAATQEAVDAQALGVRAQETWNRLDAAYRTASASVVTVQNEVDRFVGSSLANAVKDVRTKPVFMAADFVGNGGEAAAALSKVRLSQEAQRLRQQATAFSERVRTAPPGTPREVMARDIADADRFRAQARNLAPRIERLAKGERLLGRAAGPLAVAGVAWDIANGKPADQAIVSGAVGFGAAVATGAAIGTLIPVPIVGTAIGAVVGAGVGLFASGAVDSLYENGAPQVGRALADGAKAVGDAGAAIGDLATEVWDAIF